MDKCSKFVDFDYHNGRISGHIYCEKPGIFMEDYNGLIQCFCQEHWEEELKEQEKQLENRL